jgi:hypothetical protein
VSEEENQLTGRVLTSDDIAWLETYRSDVAKTFSAIFAEAADRFKEGPQLLRRFNDAVDAVLNGSTFRPVDEAHNELCLARALLANTKPRFTSLAYEPPLSGCAQSIDFRPMSAEGLTAWVDVKTIKPEPKDRWQQFEQALREGWLPENVTLAISKEWMGGEIWHGMFAARARMLEYTRELERKIRECGLTGYENTLFILAFCGAGFEWHEDQLEDFVQFYRSGRHRSEDPFAKVEAHFMQQENIVLERSVMRFACMKRRQGELYPARLNWNVQPPKDPEVDE